MLLFIFGICFSNSEEASRSIPELQSLDSKYKAAVKAQTQKTIKPLEKLFDSYKSRMEILMKNFQKSGNLEGVVAARSAIESEPKTSNINAKFEDISKLQKIYISEKKKITDLDKKANDVLLEKYLTALDALRKKITQEGRIDDAVFIDKFINEINNSKDFSELNDVVAPDQPSNPISDFEFEEVGKEVILKKYWGKNKLNIVVPKEYEGKKITTIGPQAFLNRQEIRTITMPDSIIYIRDSAFYRCSELVNIKLSKSLKVMENAALGRTALREIKLPSGLLKMGAGVFTHCPKLTSIEIPNSLTDIGAGAFGYCLSLEKLSLPENLMIIDQVTFRGSGIKQIELPKNVKTIGNNAFLGCENLESVTINGVQRIEDEAFRNTGDFKLIFNGPPPNFLGKNVFRESNPLIQRPFGVSGWGDEWAGYKVNVIR